MHRPGCPSVFGRHDGSAHASTAADPRPDDSSQVLNHLRPAGMRTNLSQVGAAAVITRFATFLNARVPAPESAMGETSCPPPVNTYALRFTARAKHGTAVTASAFCG